MHSLPLLLLLLQLLMLVSGLTKDQQPTIVKPTRLDFSGSLDDLTPCDRMRFLQTGILTIGTVQPHFLLITTDLYVFELDRAQIDAHRLPPYKILINQEPVHFRQRFPRSYPHLERAASAGVYYSWLGSIYSPEDNALYQYVFFVTPGANQTGCASAIDLKRDEFYPGPCLRRFTQYRIFSLSPNPQAIQFLSCLESHARAPVFDSVHFLARTYSGAWETNKPCVRNFTNCVYPWFAWSNKTAEIRQAMQAAEALHFPHPLVAAYQYNGVANHFMDSAGTVHQMGAKQAADKSGFPSQPLREYFACYQSPPFKLTLGKSLLIFIVIGCVVGQAAIWGTIYYLCTGREGSKDSDRRRRRRRSKRSKSKKSKSSKRKSSLSRKSSMRRSSASSKSTDGGSRSVNISAAETVSKSMDKSRDDRKSSTSKMSKSSSTSASSSSSSRSKSHR